jgi:hypothetical protein
MGTDPFVVQDAAQMAARLCYLPVYFAPGRTQISVATLSRVTSELPRRSQAALTVLRPSSEVHLETTTGIASKVSADGVGRHDEESLRGNPSG